MLDAALTAQLSTYLTKLVHPIVLEASLDEGAKSRELHDLLTQIASLSEAITLVRTDDDARRPSFAIRRAPTGDGAPVPVSLRFAGIPVGHEFTSLVLALLQVGGHPSTAAPALLDQVRALEGEHEFVTYMSLSCQNCPDVVQALNLMAVLNPGISHVAVDGALFREEVDAHQVLAVPTVFHNGHLFGQGRMTLEEIVGKLDVRAAAREVERISGLEPFDVLVIGGGPAGAAAAIYAARKGIRTALVAERFGGQVLDTMTIENLPSVLHTEGPKLAGALEAHVRAYDVEQITMQRAAKLVPAENEGGLHEVLLDSGGVLRARTVVLATGARWRTLGVDGEADYRNRGVTFCPHCDGPLFKGRPVAVIGGGNSGVEAAIDLAGIVSRVTLLEFDDRLRADEVLQRTLRSLSNVEVIVSARTTEVTGDGTRVTGLTYESRVDGSSHGLDLEAVFVQIGLLPNTEWLSGTVALSPVGEIEIDAAGATSAPGVFAAGDCTTVPFKQIVIAAGAGATAALSAFTYLIRHGVTAHG
jgi:alkyl hydroperoxide reductase subunit F